MLPSPPDLEGQGQPQRSTTQVQHHEMYAVDAVTGVDPVGQCRKLPRLLKAGQVNRQFEAGAVLRVLSVEALHRV